MVKRIVLFDGYTWLVEDKTAKRGRRAVHATRGTEIEISEAEAARGEALGALGTHADLERVQAAAAAKVPDTWQPASDDEIEKMSVAAVHAYLNAVPDAERDDEVARIVDLENLRDKPRTGVLSLAE